MPLPYSTRFWALVILGPFILLWLLMVVIISTTPIYIDHGEATMVIIAQQWLHGRPIYHSVDSPYLYSLLYGPFNYLWLALILNLCPDPILAGKLSGCFWSLATLVLLLPVFRRLGGNMVAIAGVGLVGSGLLWDWVCPFWNKPDSILIFSTSLGLCALTLHNRKRSAIVLALAIAIAIDCKLHGLLYLLPALAVWSQRQGLLGCLLVLVLAAALALTPFLLPRVSLENYLLWLRMAAHHPLNKNLFIESLETLLTLVLPLTLFAGQQQLKLNWRKTKEETVLFIALLLTGLLISIPASKMGSGGHHLEPLAAYVGYLFCSALANSSERPKLTWAAGVILIWALFNYVHVGLHCRNLWYLRNHDPGPLAQADLRQLLRKYPATDTQMGVGDEASYKMTYYSPWLYREGTPRVFDPCSYMDMKESGIGPKALTTSLTTEQFRYWLIPHNSPPFTMISWYDRQPLVDDSVRQLFSQHYAKVDSTTYFDIYQAKTSLP